MSAAARLIDRGFMLTLAQTGAVMVSPASKLDDDTRSYIRSHLDELKRELAPRHRAWRVTLTDGTTLAAVRPDGATHEQMLVICRWQFGAARVAGIEPINQKG